MPYPCERCGKFCKKGDWLCRKCQSVYKSRPQTKNKKMTALKLEVAAPEVEEEELQEPADEEAEEDAEDDSDSEEE